MLPERGVIIAEFRQTDSPHLGGLLVMLDLSDGTAAKVNGGRLLVISPGGDTVYSPSRAVEPSTAPATTGGGSGSAPPALPGTPDYLLGAARGRGTPALGPAEMSISPTSVGGWLGTAEVFAPTGFEHLAAAYPGTVRREPLRGGGESIAVRVSPSREITFEIDAAGRAVQLEGRAVEAVPVPGVEGVFAFATGDRFTLDRTWYVADASLSDRQFVLQQAEAFEDGVVDRSQAAAAERAASEQASGTPIDPAPQDSVLIPAVIIGGVLLVIIGIVAWVRRAQ